MWSAHTHNIDVRTDIKWLYFFRWFNHSTRIRLAEWQRTKVKSAHAAHKSAGLEIHATHKQTHEKKHEILPPKKHGQPHEQQQYRNDIINIP